MKQEICENNGTRVGGAVCSLIIVSHSLCLPKYELITVKEYSAWAGQIHKVHSTLKYPY